MFRIGGFSKLTRVSVRMLRYYDEAGLLKPAAIDRFTGYRMYTTDQIPALQKICLLRDMDFNVTEIREVLECWESGDVIGYLEDKKRQLSDTIRLEQQRIRKIETAMRDFMENTIETHYNVTMKSVPSHLILSLRETVADHFCEGNLWERLYAFVEEEQAELAPGVNNLAIYHNEEQAGDGVDIEVGVMAEKGDRIRGDSATGKLNRWRRWPVLWFTARIRILGHPITPLPAGWRSMASMRWPAQAARFAI